MPDRRGRRRARWAATLAVGSAALLAGPAVLAQSDVSDPADWQASTFTAPFQGRSGTVDRASFGIEGLISKERDGFERIVRVEVRFEHHDGRAPDPDDDCVPLSPAPVVGEESTDDDTATYTFSVPPDASVWPCNGRYRIVAAAQSSQEVGTYEMVGELAVAVPPLPVTVVATRFDDSVDAVEVVWEPLSEEETAVDAIGYRVERAAPGGEFVEVGEDVGLDEPTVVLDEPDTGGEHRYRVRAIRSGPEGPILSPVEGTAVSEVTVPAPPATSTTTTTKATGTTGPRISGGRVAVPGRTTPRLPSPPTTVDTGFQERLDYGDRDAPGTEDDPELAGDSGQAIIRTDDEGAGLLAPAAGALVLLGWAGHIAYLNRLARQF